MTFLELVTRAALEASISGGGPITVVNQTGKLKKLVNWVSTAWVDIQLERPNWLFMHQDFSVTATAGARDFSASGKSITDLAKWDRRSFYIHEASLTEDNQNYLPYISYDQWRTRFRAGMATRDQGRPEQFTVLPNKSIRLEPVPDVDYTIIGEYKRTAQHMTADADTPTGLPDDFHILIVWQALKYYGFHEDAPEVLDEAETNFDNLFFLLERDQLPEMSERYDALV